MRRREPGLERKCSIYGPPFTRSICTPPTEFANRRTIVRSLSWLRMRFKFRRVKRRRSDICAPLQVQTTESIWNLSDVHEVRSLWFRQVRSPSHFTSKEYTSIERSCRWRPVGVWELQIESWSLFHPQGYIQWQGSDAQELLKENIDSGKHLEMTPMQLWLSRPKYNGQFPPDAFRSKNRQEPTVRT